MFFIFKYRSDTVTYSDSKCKSEGKYQIWIKETVIEKHSVSNFHPCLMFSRKAGANLSETPYRTKLLRQASILPSDNPTKK